MKRARDWAHVIIAVWALSVILVSCRHRKDPKPPPPLADYTAPVWVVSRDLDQALVSPTPAELKAEYDRVTRAWLDYWKERSQGRWRPSTIPRGVQGALVEVARECSNSAEASGRGAYGVKVHAWSCTHGEQKGKRFILSAVCHRLSHVISGLGSGGNSDHAIMREVCGC